MFNGCTESGYNSPTGRVGINFHVKESRLTIHVEQFRPQVSMASIMIALLISPQISTHAGRVSFSSHAYLKFISNKLINLPKNHQLVRIAILHRKTMTDELPRDKS
ncbi:hypothetical protein PSHT_01321 [Puccinia striiformis]|uniref:Uncharacterized protein n=1 Tax=Puccinia striiformis TaxID=27350 RepID=A0A2S4WKT8_9BASI|nr:hypothetical protein PSHT_01321 [Puccinia striiformis]